MVFGLLIGLPKALKQENKEVKAAANWPTQVQEPSTGLPQIKVDRNKSKNS